MSTMIALRRLVWTACFSLLSCAPALAQDEPPAGEPPAGEGGDAGGAEEQPPPQVDEGQPTEKPAGIPQAEPEFSKEASKTEFEQGKALFLAGKFKEAEAIFNKVKGDAKAKEDKVIVEVWARGAKGSILLERIKARIKARQFGAAQAEAEAALRQFASTPAEGGLRAALKEIESQLYEVLETFDSPSPAYTEKYGKTFVRDAALTLDGTSCLRWVSLKDRTNRTLKIRRVPQDWTGYDAIELWVNVAQPPADPEIVLGCAAGGAGAKKKAGGAAGPKKKKGAEEDAGQYVASIRISSTGKKWQKLRVPISELQAQGDASFQTISYLQLQVGDGKGFDLMVDKIALVRKPGAVGAAKKGPAGQPAK